MQGLEKIQKIDLEMEKAIVHSVIMQRHVAISTRSSQDEALSFSVKLPPLLSTA